MYEKELEQLKTTGRTAILINGDYLYVINESLITEGYMVDEYDISNLMEPMDGGLCTGSAEDAIEFLL